MLATVPHNTDLSFVMAKTPCGCEVYAPITRDDNTMQKKADLQEELNTVYFAMPPIPEPPPESLA